MNTKDVLEFAVSIEALMKQLQKKDDKLSKKDIIGIASLTYGKALTTIKEKGNMHGSLETLINEAISEVDEQREPEHLKDTLDSLKRLRIAEVVPALDFDISQDNLVLKTPDGEILHDYKNNIMKRKYDSLKSQAEFDEEKAIETDEERIP